MPYNRRNFLKFLGKLFIGAVGVKIIGFLPARAQTVSSRTQEAFDLESLIGEEIRYNMSLLYFFSLAESKLSFTRNKKGQLEARFQGHTKGVANWVITPREHRLLTVFDDTKAGNKFRPLYHENYIKKGDKTKTSKFYFDYDRKKLKKKLKVGSRKPRKKIYAFPDDGLFNDVLTVFYNLRLHEDLSLSSGKKMRLHGLPGKKKNSEYLLKILSDKEKKENSFWSDRPKGAKTLVNAVIDSDVFGTRKGIFWFFFDQRRVPVLGVAEDAVPLGDVKGVMTSRKLGKRLVFPVSL